MEPERLLSSVASVILALVLFPVVMAMVASGWFEVGGGDILGMLAAAFIALAVSVLIVWKGRGVLHWALYGPRSRLSKPMYSGLTFGVTGALSVGGIMAVAILLLGHTRPMGWEFDRIPIWMAIAFLVCLGCGLSSGLERKRQTRVHTDNHPDQPR